MSPFSAELNPAQNEAVDHLDGPLLILAGAGSGKTRVLTYRAANLILQGKTTPDRFLAVTFTNKAAREMEHRMLQLLHRLGIPLAERPWVSTFHSTCARILRDHLYLLDYQPGWGIYDSSDQLSMIKKVLQALGLKEKEYPAKSFQGRINNAKMLGLEPHQVSHQKTFIMDDTSLDVYTRYEEEMKRANSLDFADLLVKTHLLFKDYPALLEEYQNRFQYIMVDEYQDTNNIQYKLVKQLAAKHQNLCVVGDEDQSIYSWRGADISNILNFEKDFPGAKTVKLEENYRSTETIVKAATHLIQNNTERKGKVLFTNNPTGEKITISEQESEYDEARYIVKESLEQISKNGRTYSDIAVFYRTNAQSRVIEEQLRGQSIPYKIVGGIKFYERKEIKDALGYMKLAVNLNDDVALKRIINTPARGIGKTTLDKIEALGNQNRTSMWQAAHQAIEEKIVHSGAIKKISGFLQLVQKLHGQAQELIPTEFYQEMLEQTGMVDKLRAEDTAEADARIDNLEEFYNAIAQFEKERDEEEGTLVQFLEEMALVSDADEIDENASSVTLMTLHISKGLEYPCVFMAGMEDGLFPSARSIDGDETSEEERRLAYVGMTRAREKLFMTYARKRRVWGQEQFNAPSRFLKEIPEEYLEQKSALKKPRFMDRMSSNSNYTGSPSYANSFKDFQNDEFPDYDSDGGFFDEDEPSYKKGTKVKHPSYGVGSIFKVEGQGDMQKVSVMFNDRTVKKFVIKYARLEIVL